MNPKPLSDGKAKSVGRWPGARWIVILVGALLSVALLVFLSFAREEKAIAERDREAIRTGSARLAEELKHPVAAEELRDARLRSGAARGLEASRVDWSPHLFRLAEFMGRLDYAWMDHLEISRGGHRNCLRFTVYTNSEGTDSVGRFFSDLSAVPWVLEHFRGEGGGGFTTELFHAPLPGRPGGRRFTVGLVLREDLASVGGKPILPRPNPVKFGD